MKYFNIKRYKFSTITSGLRNLLNNAFNFHKIAKIKNFFSYFDYSKNALKKTVKHFSLSNFNFFHKMKKIKVPRSKFLLFHFPAFLIFFGLLYIAIPIFFSYENKTIQKVICNKNVQCIAKGKISYTFFPTPRLKIKSLIVNINSVKTKLIIANDVSLKLSIKNLLAKDKHKIKKIIISDFESNINLKKLEEYNFIFKTGISPVPVFFKNGQIVLYDNKNYIAAISQVDCFIKKLENSSKLKLEGKFLNDDIAINFSNEFDDDKPITKIDLRMKNLNFYAKANFFDLKKIINNGKFLIKKDRNKISGIFNYKENKITIVKSNIRNSIIDGKITGDIVFLPYFDFNVDLNLNSINFTKLYNYFLSLDKEEQKKIFKINNKINGKLNFSSEKVYSRNNLVKSFESRIKFYNGNTKIEQFLINLGKLGAADILGKIDNDNDSVDFKFESNIFVDNQKKFLSKFGIYGKENISSNIFIQGNFDLQNIRTSFYEISTDKKFNNEDINFIESEFNELILENGFIDLFNFKKFKVFLKSVREEKN